MKILRANLSDFIYLRKKILVSFKTDFKSYDNKYIEEHTSNSYFAKLLTKFILNKNNTHYIISSDGKRIGYIIATIEKDRSDLHWFYIEKSCRGNGNGSKILIEFEKLCNTNNIFLFTKDASSFYEKNGYSLVGSRDNLKQYGKIVAYEN